MNVVIENELGYPKVTKDGVSVAKSIFLVNRGHEAGAALIRKASHGTNEFAGDGTTTSTLLVSSMMKHAIKYVNHGYNGVHIKRGMLKARDEILNYLEAIALLPRNKGDLHNVALIACNGIKEYADLVTDALWHVGPHGRVEFEPSPYFITQLHISDGLTIIRGVVKKFQQPLILLCKHISDEALSTVLYNYSQNKTDICVVTIPSLDVGDVTTPVLEDYAALTNSQVVPELDRYDFPQNFKKYIGKAKKMIANEMEITMIGSEGSRVSIASKIKEILQMMSNATSKHEVTNLQDRINRMQGKAAVVLIGGLNETEIQENRDIITDGLNSARKTMERGFVPGGGVALLRASQVLEHFEGDSFEENLGIEVVKQGIREPFTKILNNCQLNGRYLAHQLLQKEGNNFLGYDVVKEEFVDFLEIGILDSLETVRNAIIDSISSASTLATTEVCVLNERIFKS